MIFAALYLPTVRYLRARIFVYRVAERPTTTSGDIVLQGKNGVKMP